MVRKKAEGGGTTPNKPGAPASNWHDHQRTSGQAAFLIRYVVYEREKELRHAISRARISQNGIRRLCGRSQLTPDFINEVQEALIGSGWALFPISYNYFAIVRLSNVNGWARISATRIHSESGYNFGTIEEDLSKSLFNT